MLRYVGVFFICGDAGNRTRVRLISRYVSTMRVSPYIVGREVNEPNPTIASSIASLAPMTIAWSDPSYITPQFNRKEELSETAFRTRAYARAYAKAKLSAVKYGEATFCAVFALGFFARFYEACARHRTYRSDQAAKPIIPMCVRM
jgi:hypothetical protein